MTATEILAAITKLPRVSLVVVTGGEPLVQPLSVLLNLLLRDYCVQIETSGVVHQELPPQCQVVLSPKTPHINYHGIVTAWKYIIRAGDVNPRDGLPLFTTQDYRDGGHCVARPPRHCEHIYVQPCDEKDPTRNEANLRQALDSVRRFNYRLSLQIHKIIGWE